MKKSVLLLAFAGYLLTADAQIFPFGQNLSPEQRRFQDSIREVIRSRTNKDYSAMLQLLNISSVRPGVNGSDPAALNGVNYDEAKANPFPVLPDPLKLKNGSKVNSAKKWWSKRRPEIIEDFDREIYGRIPKDLPAVNWEIISSQPDTAGTTPVIIKKLIGRVDNSSYPAVEVNIELTLITPADIKSKVPVIMEFNGWHERSMIWRKSATDIPAFFRQEGPSWQEQVLNRGWALALLNPSSIQADHGAGLTEGIIGLINKGQYRKADDWGALRAWAWGAAEALNYFKNDPAADEKRVTIAGHSRYGKAALVTLAYYPQFSTGYISSSGAGGAKLHRRNFGEVVENVAAANEYHWMAGNFIKYAGPLTWKDLPVDSHELIALCAPRPVFIGCGLDGDNWTDQKGMFMAAAAAGPVYRLLGRDGIETGTYPPVNHALLQGDIAFRQHDGGHTPAPNWPFFIEFASKYFKD